MPVSSTGEVEQGCLPTVRIADQCNVDRTSFLQCCSPGLLLGDGFFLQVGLGVRRFLCLSHLLRFLVGDDLNHLGLLSA